MENPRNLYKVTLHIKPDFVIIFYSFLKVKVQWKSIEDTFVFPKPPLSIVSFILGAICNRRKNCGSTGAQTQGHSLTVRTLPLSYQATQSYHQQFSTWNLPRLQSCSHFNTSFSQQLLYVLVCAVIITWLIQNILLKC